MSDNYKIKERIKALFLWRGVTFTAFAEHMTKKKGKKYLQSSLSHKLARETITFKEVIEISRELGYEVIFKQKPNWNCLK